jgi:hypothetical protein
LSVLGKCDASIGFHPFVVGNQLRDSAYRGLRNPEKNLAHNEREVHMYGRNSLLIDAAVAFLRDNTGSLLLDCLSRNYSG